MSQNLQSADSEGRQTETAETVEDLVLVSNREPHRHRYEGDVERGARAVERALAVGDTDRRGRMRRLRQQVHETGLEWWIGDGLETARELRADTTGAS